jgi:hypothetical protein
MAYTVTKFPTVFGNKRAIGMKVVADAATQTVETGLRVIEWYSYAKGSMATQVGLTLAINSNASGVATLGSVGLSGFSSGDEFYLTVYGR